MNSTKLAATALLLNAATTLSAAPACAQEPTTPPPPTNPAAPPTVDTTAPAPAPAIDTAESPTWSFDLSAYTVNPPDDDSYASTVLRADRDWLHLEGRWNYEALHTGSLFVGRNFEWSDKSDAFGLSVVPMAGVVAGDVDGFAPGIELDATWKWLEFYDETEWVVSTHDHHDDFIYTWAELTVAPLDWMKVGLAAQRTRAYDTELSIDRAPMLSLSFERVTGTVYWFNPDKSHSYVMFSLAFSL